MEFFVLHHESLVEAYVDGEEPIAANAIALAGITCRRTVEPGAGPAKMLRPADLSIPGALRVVLGAGAGPICEVKPEKFQLVGQVPEFATLRGGCRIAVAKSPCNH